MSVMLLKSFPGTSAKSLKNCCTSPLHKAVSECDLESPRRLPFISVKKSRDTCQSFKPAFPKFKKNNSLTIAKDLVVKPWLFRVF